MTVRRFAMVMGVAFLLVGVLGFVPPLLTHPAHAGHTEPLKVTAFEGYLLGLFCFGKGVKFRLGNGFSGGA